MVFDPQKRPKKGTFLGGRTLNLASLLLFLVLLRWFRQNNAVTEIIQS